MIYLSTDEPPMSSTGTLYENSARKVPPTLQQSFSKMGSGLHHGSLLSGGQGSASPTNGVTPHTQIGGASTPGGE